MKYTYDITVNGLHLNFTEDQHWLDDNTFVVIAESDNGNEYEVCYAAEDNLTGDDSSPDFDWDEPQNIFPNPALEDLDPVEVIQTITGTRKSAEVAVRNGADREIYTPEDFVETIRAAADEDDATDYSEILAQANSGELRWEGAHNGIYNGTPFVWLHG